MDYKIKTVKNGYIFILGAEIHGLVEEMYVFRNAKELSEFIAVNLTLEGLEK